MNTKLHWTGLERWCDNMRHDTAMAKMGDKHVEVILRQCRYRTGRGRERGYGYRITLYIYEAETRETLLVKHLPGDLRRARRIAHLAVGAAPHLSPTQLRLLEVMAEQAWNGAALAWRCRSGKHLDLGPEEIRDFMGGCWDDGEYAGGQRIPGLKWSTWFALEEKGLLRSYGQRTMMITRKGLQFLGLARQTATENAACCASSTE
jgi:hypothetical protein